MRKAGGNDRCDEQAVPDLNGCFRRCASPQLPGCASLLHCLLLNVKKWFPVGVRQHSRWRTSLGLSGTWLLNKEVNGEAFWQGGWAGRLRNNNPTTESISILLLLLFVVVDVQ